MASFNDALRGYAFHTIRADNFRCRYCGLDGTKRFEDWLSLSEEHLLPDGHPNRNNRDYIVCACRFCNGAANQYFKCAHERGLSLDGKTPEELIAQRLPFILATTSEYKAFWELRVKDHAVNATVPTGIDLAKLQQSFVLNVAKSTNHEQAANNAILAALQRSGTYASGNVDGAKFRKALASELNTRHDFYAQAISDAEHCATISQIADSLSMDFKGILKAGRLRIGIVQKALNLYLKTAWSLDPSRPDPPHCPIDRIVLQMAGIDGKWTELDSIETYQVWIERLRQRAADSGYPSLSVWELHLWS